MQRGQLTHGQPDGRRRRLLRLYLIAGVLLLAQGLAPARAAAGQLMLRSDQPFVATPVAGGADVAFAFERLPRSGVGRDNSSPGDDAYAARPQEQYLPYILAGASAILLQGLLLNWLLRERGQRRRSDAEAHETMLQLAHMNRIATAGELSASIAHELTQPITGMVAGANAALRWLAEPTPQIDKARSALKQVVSAGDHTKQLIHGVRAMFKNEPEDRRAVDINEVINGVLELVHDHLERHQIVIETDLASPPVPVLGDIVQLQQVVLNLTLNAVEAMAGIDSRPRLLRLRTEHHAHEVSISIEDVGVGIPKGAANEIFEPLYTTKPQGMGMGLSICRSIVEAHEGRIWVSPAKPHGTVFHIVLPASG